MSENAIVLLVCLAVIAVMAILIYVGGRRQITALTTLCEVHRGLDQILAGNREIKTTLEQHRRVLYDAHKQIHTVTKALRKPTS
jgi:hypothetical protein